MQRGIRRVGQFLAAQRKGFQEQHHQRNLPVELYIAYILEHYTEGTFSPRHLKVAIVYNVPEGARI